MNHPLQDEAAALAASLNPIIVASAMRTYSSNCTDCNYMENVELFDRLREEYTRWKIRFHHICNREHDSERRLSGDGWLDMAFVNMTNLHHKLRQIWPCESCMARFNPTRRKRNATR